MAYTPVPWYTTSVFARIRPIRECLPTVSPDPSGLGLLQSDKDNLYQFKDNLVTNIFVGNLSYQTTQDDLYAAFAQYGAVERVNIITDRDSGQSRGFAFVEITDRNEAANAINGLNGAELNGRALNVNEARPKPQGGGGFGGGGGRGGYGGGGGGGRGRGNGGGGGRGPRW
jgi:uncharacterized membrane protein YgcG